MDGGGTRTLALALSGAGAFLGFAEDGGCNAGRHGMQESVRHAAGAMGKALSLADASGRDRRLRGGHRRADRYRLGGADPRGVRHRVPWTLHR